MSLRFFRKKPGDKKPVDEIKDEPKETKPTRSRSRRTASSSAGKSEATTEGKTPSRSRSARKPAATKGTDTPIEAAPSIPTTETSSSSPAKATNGRRRGRRGGAGRRSAAARTADKQPAEATTAVETSTLEATLQNLAEQQVSTLKGLQGSLSAIENRLSGASVGRAGALAERPRIGIFVDVPNIMYAAERERVKLDYGLVLDFIVKNRELVRASAYAPISDDPEEELETQKFVQPFMDLGYRIVTKPLKRYANGTIKANFDVELAIDVLTMSDRLDIVVLLSGDGDFRRLVEIVASKGVRVEVIAFGPSTAAELRTVADTYIDLNDHLAELRVK